MRGIDDNAPLVFAEQRISTHRQAEPQVKVLRTLNYSAQLKLSSEFHGTISSYFFTRLVAVFQTDFTKSPYLHPLPWRSFFTSEQK